MDTSKKRKTDENGTTPETETETIVTPSLSRDDARKLLEPLTHDQLLTLLTDAVTHHPPTLSAARALADSDVTRRKLFVRGLGPDTSTDSLRSLFSSFGPLDEAVVISDKATGKSKGYGFVTFKHVDGAILALREPSKRIDGRMTVTHLASAGRGGSSEDQATRKIYVGNVPYEVSAERLLDFFSVFGDVEEGPLGFDRQGGKTRGFAFFVYKTEDGARNALVEPMKVVDGNQVMCKLAEDGKKPKLGAMTMPGGNLAPNDDNRMGPGYGPMGGYQSYGPGYSGGPYSGGGPGYGPPGGGEFAPYRGAPPSSMGMGMGGVPPPAAGGPYQEGTGYSGMSGSGFMSQGGPPPSQGLPPPQGPPPPGGMYQRVPPYY